MGKTTKMQRGQALLIVLLGMAVVMVMSLSVISRSVTDISITSKDEDALRAFSAAEAGVEQAIIGGALSGDFNNSSTYTASITEYFSGGSTYYYPDELLAGESATIWFVDHDDEGNLSCDGEDDVCTADSNLQFNVCFGEAGTSAGETSPAVEVTVFYDANYTGESNATKPSAQIFSGVNVARAVYDPFNLRRSDNNFISTENGCDTLADYAFPFRTGNIFSDMGINNTCLSSEGCLLFATIKMLYNDSPHPIGAYLTEGVNFSSQGDEIESVGTSNESTRKLEVIKTYQSPLSIFEAGVYSPNDIEK